MRKASEPTGAVPCSLDSRHLALDLGTRMLANATPPERLPDTLNRRRGRSTSEKTTRHTRNGGVGELPSR